MSPVRPWIASYSEVSSACARARPSCPLAAPLALLGERDLEPGAVDAHAVLGGELDGQVDREAVGVVEAERDVAGEDRRVGAAAPPRAARRRARRP